MNKIFLFILLFTFQCTSVESSRRISASGDPEDIFFEKDEPVTAATEKKEAPAEEISKSAPAETREIPAEDHAIVDNRPDQKFDEIGFSSWYGPKFQGKKTASGELFDKSKLTAAHPSLPLGTVIRVYNFDSNKEAIVKVNDRGPYAGNRILDVSERTAELLNFKHAGVAKVGILVVKNGTVPEDKVDEQTDDEELELTAAIEEEDKAEAVPAEEKKPKPVAKRETPQNGNYFIQLGVFMNKSGAEKIRESLKNEGHSVKIVEKDGSFIVQLGNFKVRKDAETLRDELKNKGIDCFIPKK